MQEFKRCKSDSVIIITSILRYFLILQVRVISSRVISNYKKRNELTSCGYVCTMQLAATFYRTVIVHTELFCSERLCWFFFYYYYANTILPHRNFDWASLNLLAIYVRWGPQCRLKSGVIPKNTIIKKKLRPFKSILETEFELGYFTNKNVWFLSILFFPITNS